MANVTIEELLQIMVERGGSDLHISAGSPPKVRVDGRLYNTEHELLRPDDAKTLIYSYLTGDQIARFEKAYELDMSFGIERPRSLPRRTCSMQRGAVGSRAPGDPLATDQGLPTTWASRARTLRDRMAALHPEGTRARDRRHG